MALEVKSGFSISNSNIAVNVSIPVFLSVCFKTGFSFAAGRNGTAGGRRLPRPVQTARRSASWGHLLVSLLVLRLSGVKGNGAYPFP